MCNTLQQIDKVLIISNLTADNILSLTKYCQHFFCFGANFWCIYGEDKALFHYLSAAHEKAEILRLRGFARGVGGY
jgi:hypothetical protein